MAASVNVVTEGQSGNASNAVQTISRVLGDQEGARAMVLLGPLSNIVASTGGSGNDILYAGVSGSHVLGLGGNDLIIGASLPDTSGRRQRQ